MKYLTLALILVPTLLTADPLSQENALHEAAHAGGVYAVTHITEVMCTKAIGKEHKTACTVAGAVTGNAMNVAYKAAQKFPNDTNRAIGAGLLGSGIAATVISIDW